MGNFGEFIRGKPLNIPRTRWGEGSGEDGDIILIFNRIGWIGFDRFVLKWRLSPYVLAWGYDQEKDPNRKFNTNNIFWILIFLHIHLELKRQIRLHPLEVPLKTLPIYDYNGQNLYLSPDQNGSNQILWGETYLYSPVYPRHYSIITPL